MAPPPEGVAPGARNAKVDLVGLRRRCRRLRSALAAAARVATHMDPARVLDAVVADAVATTGAGWGSLALIEGSQLVTVAVSPRGVDLPRSYPLGEGIAGRVAATGKSERHHSKAASDREGAYSVLSVPIEGAGQRHGVLTLHDSLRPEGFLPEDEQALQGVATYAGSLLTLGVGSHDTPTLAESLDLRNIELALVGRESAAEALQMVADIALDMLSARICLVLSFLGEGQAPCTYTANACSWRVMSASVSLHGESLATRAIESGLPAWVEDGVEPPRLQPRELNELVRARAGIAVPIRDGARVTGVVLAYHSEPRCYTADETRVLTALAAHAGAAVRNHARAAHHREVADTIRRSLLPRLPARGNGLAFGQAFIPRADSVGGDYYDVTPLPHGGHGIVVGDVSGSGLKAAIYTAMGKYMLRAFAFETPSPGAVLAKLNSAVCAQGYADLFLTLFYGILEPSGRLIYANGAHPYPILRPADGGAGLAQLETTGTVVGILPDQVYQEREVQLNPGDILLLYTDGAIEAAHDGVMFGVEGLLAAVREWHGDDPQGLVDHLVRRLQAFTGGMAQDDTALLAVQLRPGA